MKNLKEEKNDLDVSKRACKSVMDELNYEESVVIGSYIGKLEEQTKRYKESYKKINDLIKELEGSSKNGYNDVLKDGLESALNIIKEEVGCKDG